MNAILEDDFWQVVKNEKLQEGDFEIESSMSIGGSHWYRPMSTRDYRSMYSEPSRSTGSDEHRSMDSEESTRSCNAVRIMTHEEFAARHPHPPRPFEMDRQDEYPIDQHREEDID